MKKIIKCILNRFINRLINRLIRAYIRSQSDSDLFNGLKEKLLLEETILNKSRRSLALLRDIHKGKRCFIIGNGPSLTISDLELLRNEVTFASNKIYLAFPETNWRPTYYNSEDILVLEQNSEIIKQIEDPLMFFPQSAIDVIGDKHNAIFYNVITIGDPLEPLKNKLFPGFSSNITAGINWGSTVVYSQIQIAAYLGFTEIYLLGIDFRFSLPEQKEKNVYISEGELNHFHKDYRKKGEKWFQPNLDVQKRSFDLAKSFCEERKLNIYNATRGGDLEIFTRKKLEEVINCTHGENNDNCKSRDRESLISR